MNELPGDPQLFGATYGDDIMGSPQAEDVTQYSAPTTTPDFNSGGSEDPLAVLTSVAATAGKLAQVVTQFQTIPQQLAINRASIDANKAITLQTLSTQGKLASLQNATVLAQAQAAYNKAAGVLTPDSWTLILTIAGVALAAAAIVWNK